METTKYEITFWNTGHTDGKQNYHAERNILVQKNGTIIHKDSMKIELTDIEKNEELHDKELINKFLDKL